MTERRDGFKQSYPQHHFWTRSICLTPGCYTFVTQRGGQYCLACQLDLQLPQPRMDRPRKRASDEALG